MSQEENNGRINEVIARAFQDALSREHEYVTLEHILRVMLEEEESIVVRTPTVVVTFDTSVIRGLWNGS